MKGSKDMCKLCFIIQYKECCTVDYVDENGVVISNTVPTHRGEKISDLVSKCRNADEIIIVNRSRDNNPEYGYISDVILSQIVRKLVDTKVILFTNKVKYTIYKDNVNYIMSDNRDTFSLSNYRKTRGLRFYKYIKQEEKGEEQ